MYCVEWMYALHECMHWINQCLYPMKEWINYCMNGWIHALNEWMHQIHQTNCMQASNVLMYEWMHEWMNQWMDACMYVKYVRINEFSN